MEASGNPHKPYGAILVGVVAVLITLNLVFEFYQFAGQQDMGGMASGLGNFVAREDSPVTLVIIGILLCVGAFLAVKEHIARETQ
ncbi:hypothetical protein HYS48_01600 [Candidatus Woesearchaeota archaeon]|nr:hypothetical protein [Candidatus Woesearchaeota archaeon]